MTFGAMAAFMKLQRGVGFGSVLLRNATLFIRPRVQKPVVLKHQLTGNTQMYTVQINIKPKMIACLLFCT
jgi:hypothetical protein